MKIRTWDKVQVISGKSADKPIDVSNVMLICPFTERPTRVGFVKIEEKWKIKKFRFSKKALKEKWWEASKYIIK